MIGSHRHDRKSVRWAATGLMAWLIGVSPAIVHSYSSGAPDGYTGAPGEETCFTCHDNFPLNSGGGAFSITAPDQFEAGETYEVAVSLEQTGQSRWGFEFTPLDVGTCTITDGDNTQASSSGGNSYVKQTTQGSFAGNPGPVAWSFEWTAPEDPPDEVTFYAAGNAGDGDGATGGDYVYTAFAISVLTPAAADDGPTASACRVSLSGSPNPIYESATLLCSVPAPAGATLAIHDARGRLVTTLFRGETPASPCRITWYCTDAEGRPVPAGLYVCRLSAFGQVAATRLVVVR